MSIRTYVFGKPESDGQPIPPREGFPERLNLTHPHLLTNTRISPTLPSPRTGEDTGELRRLLREKHKGYGYVIMHKIFDAANYEDIGLVGHLTDLQFIHLWDFLQGRIATRLKAEPTPSKNLEPTGGDVNVLLNRIESLERQLKRAKEKEAQLRERILAMRGFRGGGGGCCNNYD